jgi:hypothetical protein
MSNIWDWEDMNRQGIAGTGKKAFQNTCRTTSAWISKDYLYGPELVIR